MAIQLHSTDGPALKLKSNSKTPLSTDFIVEGAGLGHFAGQMSDQIEMMDSEVEQVAFQCRVVTATETTENLRHLTETGFGHDSLGRLNPKAETALEIDHHLSIMERGRFS